MDLNRAIIFFLFPAIVLFVSCRSAPKKRPTERYYQKIWCDARNGRMEVRLRDNTRCDCVTSRYAVEVDFVSKRFEGVGQALHYAWMLQKKAGLVLICRKPSDKTKVRRTKEFLKSLPPRVSIRVWLINC